MIIREIKVFLSAILFFTRIPVPFFSSSQNSLKNAVRYFPLIGLIVAGFIAMIFCLSDLIFPFTLAIILSMISGLLITGAMHEDGFADFCDGYGSGLARNRILEIMKDSSTGVYGTIGLICILAIKFIALLSTGPDNIPIILIVAHTFSRLSPVVLMFSSKYARDTESSKVGIVCSRPSLSSLTVAVITGFSPLFILGMLKAVVIILICAVLFIGFRAYILKRTGGYTGDVLGALQQITEITIYLINIALD